MFFFRSFNASSLVLLGYPDASRSYIAVSLQSRDEQSHQVGRDIYLQCGVQGSVERPYEYQYTKDGAELDNSKTFDPRAEPSIFIVYSFQMSKCIQMVC